MKDRLIFKNTRENLKNSVQNFKVLQICFYSMVLEDTIASIKGSMNCTLFSPRVL